MEHVWVEEAAINLKSSEKVILLHPEAADDGIGIVDLEDQRVTNLVIYFNFMVPHWVQVIVNDRRLYVISNAFRSTNNVRVGLSHEISISQAAGVLYNDSQSTHSILPKLSLGWLASFVRDRTAIEYLNQPLNITMVSQHRVLIRAWKRANRSNPLALWTIVIRAYFYGLVIWPRRGNRSKRSSSPAFCNITWQIRHLRIGLRSNLERAIRLPQRYRLIGSHHSTIWKILHEILWL
mmetsp:Transcript_124795/g.194817  ORF Transcript_124795/g.194817 Transcript_124795/m.194817 type:complete len:236 (-) Transcript_124795:510-1217(-)